MFLSLFLAFDSFAAALALGLLTIAPERRSQICFLFGLCDGVATLVGLHLQLGSALALRSSHPWIVPAGMCAWILFVGFLIRRMVVRKPTNTLAISLVPLILGLDNFFAGRTFLEASSPVNTAIAAGLFSASLALGGFAIAALVQNRMSKSIAIGLAAALLCLTPILF
jgi:putative Mn2+ efflux pump MntP